MKKIITVLILALTTPCIAQSDFMSFFSRKTEGETYFLPDTKINITVEVCCIRQTPGELCSYAERYLHIKDAITEPSERWEIVGIDSYNEGIPCKDKTYIVKLNGSNKSDIIKDDKGIIEAINTEPFAKADAGSKVARQNTNNHTDASQYMTEEMHAATTTAKMAELAAKEIYSIRESKLAITRGQSEYMPKDAEGITLLLQELEKQERAFTEMFKGLTDTLYYSYNYEIIPNGDNDTTKEIIFRFSQKLGVLDKENLAGEPIYYELKNLKTVERPKTNEATTEKKGTKPEGIYYNIPGRARMEVYTRTKTFIDKEIPIAQFGTTEILSKTHFGKNNTTKVQFDTTAGSIINIKRH